MMGLSSKADYFDTGTFGILGTLVVDDRWVTHYLVFYILGAFVVGGGLGTCYVVLGLGGIFFSYVGAAVFNGNATFLVHGCVLLIYACGLVPALLDGLVGRSRVTENRQGHVNYYIEQLRVDQAGGVDKAISG